MTSSVGCTGFAMCIWNPLAMAVTRSSERAYAVSAAAGIRLAGAGSVRLIWRISSRPSILGMPMSAMSASKALL